MTSILGYLVFGDLPSAQTWLGIAIVVSCGLYISWRQQKIHPHPDATTSPEYTAAITTGNDR